ncbi:hypothetical protein [Psychromonas aquimarina]|uniref:hypothetical protein n=1 Tax=Psychromonas aquimarina TaxID=444919 RepID=UPI0004086128|nr:hypothetical protein [Psychromonas aquimarina]
MSKLISLFASALLAASLFTASAFAVESTQFSDAETLNNDSILECLTRGRAGCRD